MAPIYTIIINVPMKFTLIRNNMTANEIHVDINPKSECKVLLDNTAYKEDIMQAKYPRQKAIILVE